MNNYSYIPDSPEWLKFRTIYLVRVGSQAYGTATPESDLDVAGIAVPPMEWLLGYSRNFAQAVAEAKKGAPADVCIYGVQRYFQLAADANPNVLELLWVDEEDVLITSPLAKMMRAQRSLFLSQKVRQSFGGYALGQMKRVETHRRWLLTPPKAPPDRAAFGLPERRVLPKEQQGAALSQIEKQLDSWELDLSDLDSARRIYLLDQIRRVLLEMTTGIALSNTVAGAVAESRAEAFKAAARLIGFEDNFLEYLAREKAYNAAARNWAQYQEWLQSRNPARAALEAKYGYDCKHASHTLRLSRTCKELLLTGQIHVRRPDAEELSAIRHGAWSYEKLKAEFEKEDLACSEALKVSLLPERPNVAALDRLSQHIHESATVLLT